MKKDSVCPHILCFMVDPNIRSGGTKRYLQHASQFATWAQVTILTNQQLQLPSHPIRRIDVCNRGKRPIYGWMIYFWLAVRNVKRANLGTIDYILIYGSNNILAAVRLKRITSAPLIFDPRQNDIDCLRMQYNGAQRALSHTRYAHRLLLWVQMQARIFIQHILYVIIAHYADLMLFQTDYELKAHRKQMPLRVRNMAVLPNSIGMANATTDDMPPLSTPVTTDTELPKSLQVLFCGGLYIRKGIWETINAILQLWSRGVALSLTAIGDGTERTTIDAYLRAHNLIEHNVQTQQNTHTQYRCSKHSNCSISLHGWVSTPRTFFRASDILVVPSYVEAFPDVILEALEVAIPVVASDIPNIRYMLNHDELLFAAQSTTALATKLSQLVNRPATIKHYQTLCQSRRALFSFDYSSRFQQVIRGHITAT